MACSFSPSVYLAVYFGKAALCCASHGAIELASLHRQLQTLSVVAPILQG